MRTTSLILLLLLLHIPARAGEQARIGSRLQARYDHMTDEETAVILITLRDKGPRAERGLLSATGLVSPRSLARRARVRPPSALVDLQDLPLDEAYVGEVSKIVPKVRHLLKWFNAVSAEATKTQIDALAKLPFVRTIELVGRWKRIPEPIETPSKTAEETDRLSAAHTLDYGPSLTQNEQINVPAVHDLGITGQGVMIGVFDNGVRLLTHESFASMNIVAQYDFVDHKVSVVPSNPSTEFGWHGVMTLSTIGGYKPGQLIGPAFAADYVLARTENDSSETPVEEDNWAAAIEWADSIGIDVASTSLGYLGYDSGYGSWSWEDMDGNSTIITKAADHAVALGIVVVNSAGNEGPGNGIDNTLIAPADGDSVIAAGAVYSNGIRTSFSSVGPTTDVPPRIKPDVMAMGSGVRVASFTNPIGYVSASGTSFSCPLSAGVAALILSANPTLGPLQVRDAMRNTANNAASPNNQYGWGILNADSAIRYWGILPMAQLSGTVFDDHNGNGVRDSAEEGLPGETIIITGPTVDTTVSGVDGEFLFDSLAPGSYSISAATGAGWIVTTSPDSLNVSLLHRETLSGPTVGLFLAGSVSGHVFNDSNANGMRDTNEAGLGGWTVHLTGTAADSVTTDTSGAYLFSGLLPGSYSISQVPESGWLQSLPPGYGNYTVTIAEALDTTLDFGNVQPTGNLYAVTAGWNLLSLPLSMVNPVADSVYPNRLSAVTLFDTAYYPADTIPNGKGYWVKFPAPQNILIDGLVRTHDTVAVTEGWNLIGTLSGPVAISTIVQDPDTLVSSPFYGFDAYSYVGTWAGDSLLPHRGYWVKCRSAGILILTVSE